MAATVSFTCPQCKAQLRGPAEMQGKKGRCKRCNHVFVLKADGPARTGAAPPKGASPAQTAGPPTKGKPSRPPAKKPGESDTGPAMYQFVEGDAGNTTAAAAKPAQTADQQRYDSISKNPYAVVDLDLTPRCPFCAKELESADAIICLHCGYNSQSRSHPAVKRTYANTGMDMFLWLLPGIACVIVDLGLIGFICYLWLGLDPSAKEGKDEWWMKPAQVWGSIVSAGLIWIGGLIAVKRLILHPTPPEAEKK